MDAALLHASHLVARHAAALGIAPPAVRLVTASRSPCYEALFNRIELNERTLALPEPLLSLVLAHEVGHATQRLALLADLVLTMLAVALLIAVPCVAFVFLPDDDLWRVSIPGAGFAMLAAVSWTAWRPHAAKRAIAMEIDADAKAAQVCGAQPALLALEALAMQGIVDAVRLEAMRGRVHGHASASVKNA
ncbi:M48 family metallopeptidase [Caballeronia sp. Lep1P3]|uniref:M48 family metallopeptidase n=1 Tax=Caballeronia sp. Lep1P3 TaxID=2878150 RepID=UPI001FD40FF4|nr:M48 family metallopeptidase [Caballeronia sp. Lep1P3]